MTGRQRSKPTLRLSIGVALVGVVVLVAAVIIGNSWVSARRGADSAMAGLTRMAGEQIAARITDYLKPATDVTELVRRRLAEGEVSMSDPETLQRWFFELLESHPTLGVVAYGTEADGGWVMVKRLPDGSLDTKIIRTTAGKRETVWYDRALGAAVGRFTRRVERNDPYDPRKRPWYQKAIAAKGLVWSEVYVFWTDGQPGVTAAVPMRRNGRAEGVVAVDLNLSTISRFVSDLRVGAGGSAVIVDQRGRVIAGGNAAQANGALGEGAALQTAAASDHAEIAALARTPDFARITQAGVSEPQEVHFETANGARMAHLRSVALSGGERWIVAVVLPEAEFLGPLKRAANQNIWTSLAMVLVALLLGSMLTRRIATSLRLLQRESDQIRELSFTQSRDESPFREIDDVLKAFDQMKVGLRSFRKFVPVKLVREMLERHEEAALGGEFREVTIYFSDIEGFTPINERMHPMEMAERLGRYLGALTHLLQDEQGTVVQYVGDEIMALFGAPQAVSDHAARACEGALRCVDQIPVLWGPDDPCPVFRTRFGLHTAKVAVGHFGSEDRMYYGAIGDGINLTSRLEGLNKHYGTTVLATEATKGQAGDGFVWRRVDRVAVKGKALPVAIFELMGRAGGVAARRVALAADYEAALGLYFDRRFDEATVAFEPGASAGDGPSEVMLARCRSYAQQPPPDDWDGVHVMTQK